MTDIAAASPGRQMSDGARTPELLSIVYTSRATEAFDDGALSALLSASRTSNAAVDITGFLLHRDGRFIQFLEGPEYAVRRLVEKIARDPRHTRVRVLLEDFVATRSYAEWTMGYEPSSDDDASLPEGFRRCFDDLETGSDRTLMQQAADDLTRWFRARSQA
jgi:hypothetical protein